MEKNIKKFFENKNDLINLKNKEKTTFINSNVTVNIHNKSRMRKIQNQSQNNLTIYGEKKKIFFSVDDQIKKNIIVYYVLKHQIKKRNQILN